MTQVIHCSVGNISLFHIGSFRATREIQVRRFHGSARYSRIVSPSSRRLLQPQTAFHLISIYKRRSWSSAQKPRTLSAATVGTDVTVEDQNPSSTGETSDENSEAAPVTAEASEQAESSTDQASSAPKLGRNIRKSEMPPLNDEDLVPGASFTGKVRSIKPFGVFVDIGAFTEGLVHISRVSDGFVKDISSLFTVGQEVSVRLLEANTETGRISLTMREGGDYVKPKNETPKAASGGRSATTPTRSSPRQTKERQESKATGESKFVQGQSLNGTVKNTTRSGTFVTLPDGSEGFLPREEEAVALFTLIGQSAMEVGKQIRVKVLNVAQGQVTLTMKEVEDDEDDLKTLNMELKRDWSRGTNAFELAFRRNKEISSFLDQRERTKVPEAQGAAGAAVGTVLDDEVGSEQSQDKESETSKAESVEDDSSVSATETEGKEEGSSSIEAATSSVEEAALADEESGETLSSVSEVATDVPAPVSEASSQEGIEDSTSVADAAGDQTVESENSPTIGVELSSNGAPDSASVSSVPETEDKPADLEESSAVEEVPVTASSGSVDDATNDSVEKEPAAVAEAAPASSEKTGAEAAAAGVEQASTTTATISPALVKQLREATGAGMMDCKKALAESGGDIEKAQEFLRKKGLAAADKRAGRATADGRIGSYIHDSRIGVLIEVNCETDFVSRGDIFKELVDDLAMQIAACPQVQYISIDDVPVEVVKKETELEMQREDLLSKPEQIRSKIVEGRVKKRLGEFALFEQPFIKNDKVTISEWVKQTIATIGENMKVKRFVRYNLGEGLEKKSQDFAAEVAAQTAAKPSPSAPPNDDKPVETIETAEKKPAVAVSAALVKQLRDETGAGMMDCKKALAETGGDLQKAQEFLRKKGLSSADKKSSRIAAEGLIGSYIHDNRIGCMIEVNSETDFVARNEKFKELVNDLAMQVVACPQVDYVSVEDIPESVVSQEKEIEMQREDLQSKPENIREKIVEGRIAKRLGVMALLEQPFIKDDSKTVKDLVKEMIASLGENIKVRRFARYTLGEN
ncbi:polyprotein of EF-Ts, chloroplastic-like [Phragmites australis]|uniref:polyprotein of EF-Ts, chloroplastic-like n=1 Tax=Phragmites australis TaxID=29695 RepID=UPI002D76D721|nr:polyprotein of EF-Ts, chloroplastic-like [Phragmites australis]XP_062204072.1 polyprotein of EF-Ts, chloroplastic-like [Phragmites australis]XP_062204073.1 polyprotein of EF-Ts, chloroplastic-like [Phragmites australis]XP_062204074.1 polyprotein of EF-Ts, chloroplastic-like [Phragmites australis]